MMSVPERRFETRLRFFITGESARRKAAKSLSTRMREAKMREMPVIIPQASMTQTGCCTRCRETRRM